MTLIVYFDNTKEILNIVSKYQKEYNADVYKIEISSPINFFTKLKNDVVSIKRCDLNLQEYENIILVSILWHNEIPKAVIRFLEQSTGKIKHITYVLYNHNKEDRPLEFDKMDQILNLKRNKSFFVSLDKKQISVRVYQ